MTISHLLRTTALAGPIFTILALSTVDASQTELPSEKTDATSQCTVKAEPPTSSQSSSWWWPGTWFTKSKPAAPPISTSLTENEVKKEGIVLKDSSEETASSVPSVAPPISVGETISKNSTDIEEASSTVLPEDFVLLDTHTQKEESSTTIPPEVLPSSGETTSAPSLTETQAKEEEKSQEESPSILERPQEENNLPSNSIISSSQSLVPPLSQGGGEVKSQPTPERFADTFASDKRLQTIKKPKKPRKKKRY